ncbi:TPA: hypothetical protein GND40_004766 [Salmonella enterica subsp. indica]|uniref:Uncharacterized protein n=3 Tax=Salmonella enterica TaxID=28901 RepID=A0A753E4H4_SALER|nr:hypothetical protein [Salmonella enterica subsp. indica]EAW0638016.1 hypothetical protein [Salmonella enterica]EBH9040712.1 hypothetical protein [Salmonella enterica subsp. indica serovar 11:b:e,n,x]ECD2084776.1 hypothetical protein [Salmonella enterica subsp. enterica]EDQ3256147.1 hypothetical protein [Salmonella enterica subsp. enterica serovar Farmsen]EEM2504242.1 hypothetical protein [Salmonella enterica subsp. indica serovar 45:a:e,n,x]
MSWQKLVLMNYTQMRLADAPAGLVQPLACSETSSEQARGFRFGTTKLNTITRNFSWILFLIVLKYPGWKAFFVRY